MPVKSHTARKSAPAPRVSKVTKVTKQLRPSAIRDALLERFGGGNAEPLSAKEAKQLAAATKFAETADKLPHALDSDAELEPIRALEMRRVMELQDRIVELVFGNIEHYRAFGPGEYYRDLKEDLRLIEQFYRGAPGAQPEVKSVQSPRRSAPKAPQLPPAVVDSDGSVSVSPDDESSETLMDTLHGLDSDPHPRPIVAQSRRTKSSAPQPSRGASRLMSKEFWTAPHPSGKKR